MSCPYCGRTGDCPHWEPEYNGWSKDGKGSFMRSFLWEVEHAWLSPTYDPYWKERHRGFASSGSSMENES